jgi:hypothetical protein
MSALTALGARQRAMAVNKAEAVSVSPQVAKVRDRILAQVKETVAETAELGEFSHSSCVANVPPPGPLEKLRYPNRLQIREDVLKAQDELLQKAVGAVAAQLESEGYAIASKHGSVSDYDASGFVSFGLSW